ncbi:MAG: hypothetical protein ACKVUS_21975 [Saprospiraceae bacterium]
MNSNLIFDTVRQLVGQGDTDQALQTLLSFLEKDGSQPPDTLRALRVVEGNYNTARRNYNNGILNFAEVRSEYARVNDALLSLLEDIESGRKPSQGARRNARLPWLIGGGVLLLLGIAAGIWITRPNKLKCPDFEPTGFKVMVLEFQKLSGEAANPASGLQTRIRDLTSKNQLSTDVEILPGKQFGDNTPDLKDAAKMGKGCSADMVVWGQYEQGDKSIEVDIRYAFTDDAWPPGAAMQTFKNVSEIKSGSMKINSLDEAVFRICTALALHENRMDLAKKWLNKLQQPNAREQEWKEVLK